MLFHISHGLAVVSTAKITVKETFGRCQKLLFLIFTVVFLFC